MGPFTRAGEATHALKYRLPGETFRDSVNRVSAALKDSDDHYHRLRDVIGSMRFTPGGRILAAMGTGRNTTAFNCFASGTIADSFVHGDGNIMQRATEGAATMRASGGMGYDFSTLRPKGALIKKLQSHSSGPLAFMRIYSEVCLATRSAGHRRGAQMGVLRIDHPDVQEFINAKHDQETLKGFNLSVAVTDEFMECLATGRGFDLRFGGEVYQTVDPEALWESLMQSTWDWAEPGVLFIDTINRRNNLSYCETIAATNPCFTGDTKVWTDRGNVPFQDLVGKTVRVLTQTWDGKLVYRPMSDIRVTRRKAKLVEVRFEDGQRVRCTPNHSFFLRTGGQIEAERLQPGMSIASVYRVRANQKGYLRLRNGMDAPLEHHIPFEDGIPEGYDVHHKDEVKTHNWSENLELLSHGEHRSMHMRGDLNPMRRFPERNYFLGRPMDGEKNGRWRPDLDTGLMIEDRESGMSYEAIAEKHGCSKYTAQKRIKENNHTVLEVVSLEEVEDVYCGTVDEFHRFFVALGDHDGILVHNCGEQPLPPFGACLLGSFNLTKYLSRQPVSVDAIREGRAGPGYSFDWDQLREDVPDVVRALDNVIDRTEFPLPEQAVEARNKRRMGIGVMGLANALEAMGHPYGTPGFLSFQSDVLRFIANETYRASSELAAEKGAFPLYSADHYLDAPFIKTLDDDVRDSIRRFGIRNSHLTSIAPTGTISMANDNVSSGAEPVFSYAMRRVIDTPDGPLEMRLGDYGADFLGVQGRRCDDISIEEHVDVLIGASRWVDSAVSKTCNTDGNVPWASFKEAYRRAWEGGARGCTTFNKDGKRWALLKSDDEPVEKPKTEVEGQTCRIDPETGRRECA